MTGKISTFWLPVYTKLLVVAVLFLIFAGALVTSNDAGLAVPDWPTTYGENMFLFPPSKWRANIFYEHGHRLIASAIGLMTLILAIWIGRVETRRSVRWLAYGALAAVIIQGLLGGLTVLYLLPTPISVAHAVLAQTFFSITIVLAYTQSKELRKRAAAPEALGDRRFLKYAAIVTGLVYIQLILGAVMRHTQSGLAIPDFPTMGGQWLPLFDSTMLASINDRLFEIGADIVEMSQVVIHMLHRIGAVLVSAGILLMLQKCRKFCWQDTEIRNLTLVVFLLLVVQFTLGVATVLSVKAPNLTSFHVVTGAALLGACILITIRAYLLPSQSHT